MNLKTIKKLIDASSKKALQTSAKKSKDIEVLPALTKKDKKIVEEIIEEADTLSPKLKDVDLPKYEPFSKLDKQKALLATIPVGAGVALGYNQLNKNLPEQQASSLDNSIKDEEEGPLASNRSIMAALTSKDTNIEAPVTTEEKIQQKVSAASTLPIGSTEQSKPEEESDLQNIDFGDNSIARLEALRDALSRSRDAVFANSAARLGAATAAQMSGTKNQFDEAIAGQIEQAKSIPDDYLKEVQFEKEDPNSAMSKGYRDIAKSLGFNVIGSASASDLERIIPQMSNIYNQKQAQQARAEQAALDREARAEQRAMQMAMMSQNKELAKAAKEEATLEKRIDSARKELDAGTIQKAKQSYLTAKRIEQSIAQFAKDPSGYSDYATLMGGLKTLQGDESVVRETEIRLGMNAGSLSDKVKNYMSQIATGKSLQPRQRQDIIKTVEIMKNVAKNNFLSQIQPIVKSAERRNLPLEELVTEDVVNDLRSLNKPTQENKKEEPFVARSGLTPEQRRARILELKSKKGQQ